MLEIYGIRINSETPGNYTGTPPGGALDIVPSRVQE
jgi:hypothetical protein